MKLLVPATLETGDPSLPGQVEVVRYDPERPLPRDHRDADALVLWGMPPGRLDAAARALTHVRWVQALSAGMSHVLAAGFGNDVVLTSGRGLHDGPVAEHTLALVLAAVRRLHDMRDAQAQRRWASHLAGVRSVDGTELETLRGARVTVWGFGSIAARLTPLLAGLGAQVTGVAMTSGVRHGVDVHAAEHLPALLPRTDVLICLLPSTSRTRGALDAGTFRALPGHAWLVNVGRGDVVNEDDLLRALQRSELAGAALDVFATEPLPSDSPLWAFPNLIVSPHAAGGRPEGSWALIRDNVERLLAGRPLRNVVDRERGY